MIGAIILGLIAGYVAKALVPGPDPGGCWLAGWMDGRSSPTDASGS